jgi:hypothetical protein
LWWAANKYQNVKIISLSFFFLFFHQRTYPGHQIISDEQRLHLHLLAVNGKLQLCRTFAFRCWLESFLNSLLLTENVFIIITVPPTDSEPHLIKFKYTNQKLAHLTPGTPVDTQTIAAATDSTSSKNTNSGSPIAEAITTTSGPTETTQAAAINNPNFMIQVVSSSP